MAKTVPAHWPFGVPADTDSSGADDDDLSEEDSGGEGPRPSSISRREDNIAQHAVDALNEADVLNRGQSFRLVPGGGGGGGSGGGGGGSGSIDNSSRKAAGSVGGGGARVQGFVESDRDCGQVLWEDGGEAGGVGAV